MLYTFLFGVAAFILSYIIGSVLRIDNRSPPCLLSNFAWFVMFWTFAGMFIGFGYGTSRFINGHYLPE